MPAERPRPQFASRFGVIMAFMGVAVGLGNVWRFPYMASAFGGGAFLLLYLILLCAFGIPTLMAELTLGRLSQRGPMGGSASPSAASRLERITNCRPAAVWPGI